ncbi:MAG TPA: hypothetical protein VFK30_00195 [Anaerolineae bacterium]|nr:hypothetical protein [Anaerolineae bacterium]
MRFARFMVGLMSISVSVTALAVDEAGSSTYGAIGFGILGLLLIAIATRKSGSKNGQSTPPK